MPNVETKVLLVQIFGEKSHPIRKFQRLMYWFPKFKHANPFPVPLQLPVDPVDLARLSLKRIGNDLDGKVTVYQVTGYQCCKAASVFTRTDLLVLRLDVVVCFAGKSDLFCLPSRCRLRT